MRRHSLRTTMAAAAAVVTLVAGGCEAFSPGFAEFGGERVRGLRDRAAQHDTTLALRLDTLLPGLMTEAGIDCWLTLADGPAGDPLLPLLTAAATRLEGKGALLLCSRATRPTRVAIGRGLVANETLYEVVDAADEIDLAARLNERLRAVSPERIAINDSHRFAPADGLTAANARWLRDRLAPELADRLVSSRPLVERYLATQMGTEEALLAESARLALAIAEDVLSDDTVVAAGTSLLDLDWAVRERAAALDLEIAFPPRTVVFRPGDDLEAERSMGLDLKLQPGDLVFLSFGTRYLGYANRIGRWAYLLPYDDNEAPPWIGAALGDLADAAERLAATITVGQGEEDIGRAAAAATAGLTDPATAVGRIGLLHEGGIELDAPAPIDPWDGGYVLAADTGLAIVLTATARPPGEESRALSLMLIDTALVSAGGARFLLPLQRQPLLIE